MKKYFYTVALWILVLLSGCRTGGTYNMPELTAFSIIGFLLLLFWGLGAYTNMLRDEIGDCDEFQRNAFKDQQKQNIPMLNKTNPFSLAKVQFALWTIVIASTYVYLSLCKGDCSHQGINKTALVLMGIGVGIATANAFIDKNEMQNQVTRHQDRPSRGFFIDILSDDSGISIHRFQNLVWTVIAVTIYITKVLSITSGCVLPELSDTLLALTGISGTTYIVLRSKENSNPANSGRNTANEIPATDTTTS